MSGSDTYTYLNLTEALFKKSRPYKFEKVDSLL